MQRKLRKERKSEKKESRKWEKNPNISGTSEKLRKKIKLLTP